MAEHGFYRSSGAAWQRALPPELCLSLIHI